jgi:hypothetical protein
MNADVLPKRNNLLARTGVPEYYFLLVGITSNGITGCERMLGFAGETRATVNGPGALRPSLLPKAQNSGVFFCLLQDRLPVRHTERLGLPDSLDACRRLGFTEERDFNSKTRTKGVLCEREGNSKVV